MEITGYKYNTEAEAKQAQTDLRVHYLGDVKDGQVTSEWVGVDKGTFEGATFFYIKGTFTEVLGESEIFNIDTNE